MPGSWRCGVLSSLITSPSVILFYQTSYSPAVCEIRLSSRSDPVPNSSVKQVPTLATNHVSCSFLLGNHNLPCLSSFVPRPTTALVYRYRSVLHTIYFFTSSSHTPHLPSYWETIRPLNPLLVFPHLHPPPAPPPPLPSSLFPFKDYQSNALTHLHIYTFLYSILYYPPPWLLYFSLEPLDVL